MLEFRILGPLEVVGSAGPVHLGGSKQRGTLAILLLNANRVVAIDTLADQLYAGRAPVTAATQVHRQISDLRKALGDEARIETRTPGYAIRVTPEQLDLKRFERLTEEAAGALARGEPRAALELQREALSLWRGPALADLDGPFAQNAIRRLEEILLVALEQRLDAELGLGRHRELVGELGELVAQHPANEPFVSRLMLALYRCGRQADALDLYRRTRETLVENFGIEPGRALRELERAILNQDGSLDPAADAALPIPAPEQIVLMLPSADEQLDALLAVAGPLVALPGRSLLIARLVDDEASLAAAYADLGGRRASLGPAALTAAFTTVDRADDAIRLAEAYDVRLVLLDAPGLETGELPDDIASFVEQSPADVGLLASPAADWESGDGVCVPFGGGEHDWAALELGAWLASGRRTRLRLLGARADPRRVARDASRLLAGAAISVQRVVGVDAEPQLVDPDPESLVAAAASATIVVMGLPGKWRLEGLGETRRALLRGDRPTLLLHQGPRPSGLAAAGSRTQFTWTIENAATH